LSFNANSCSKRDDVRNAQWLISKWRGDNVLEEEAMSDKTTLKLMQDTNC
jgi:hypothetical protein